MQRFGLLALVLVVGCGGAAKDELRTVTDDEPGATPKAGTEPEPVSAVPSDASFESIGAVDLANGDPMVPGGGFFWRFGEGNWFLDFADASHRDAEPVELDPPRGDSYLGRGVVSGDPVFAADLWAQLQHPEGRPLDLSAYAGIAFWARLTGSRGEIVVGFDARGEFFRVDEPARFKTVKIEASDEWQQFVLRFDESGVDPTAIASFDFVVGTLSDPYELWIDDLALVCDGPCPE
jgi:hypothetical protein